MGVYSSRSVNVLSAPDARCAACRHQRARGFVVGEGLGRGRAACRASPQRRRSEESRWRPISSRIRVAPSRAPSTTLPTCATSAFARSTSIARSTCRRLTGPGRTTRCVHRGWSCSRRRTWSALPLRDTSPASTHTTRSLFGGGLFKRLCKQAHARGLLCAPSVGPGYVAQRATGDSRVKPRLNGRTYDSMWARGPPGRRGPDHDHVVQRMARRYADRAGELGPRRRPRVRVVRRRLGAPRYCCRSGISRPHGVVVAAVPPTAPHHRGAAALVARGPTARRSVSLGRGRPHRLRAARTAPERCSRWPGWR